MKKNLHIIIISILFSIILWVSISLSNDYYAIVDIPIKLIDFPNGYSTGSKIPGDISVKLKGKGWKLIAVNLGSESDYKVPVGKTVGKRNINLYNYLVDNQWLSSDVEVMDLSPDTISFYVEKIHSKKVPIVSNLRLEFKPGYGLASPIIMSPETTMVSGPESYLKKLNSISTQNLTMKDLDDRIIKQVPLKKIQGMQYNTRFVRINLNVQKIVEKEIDDIFVHIIDVPRDRDVVLLPNKISVNVRGGIDILGRLSEKQFDAYVNYRDVVLDTLGSVAPHVKLPPNISLLNIKPERLRYIIKKFN